MEKKVLYNVLKAIKENGEANREVPDSEYRTALYNIGLVKMGYINSLTEFGEDVLKWLKSDLEKLEKW